MQAGADKAKFRFPLTHCHWRKFGFQLTRPCNAPVAVVSTPSSATTGCNILFLGLLPSCSTSASCALPVLLQLQLALPLDACIYTRVTSLSAMKTALLTLLLPPELLDLLLCFLLLLLDTDREAVGDAPAPPRWSVTLPWCSSAAAVCYHWARVRAMMLFSRTSSLLLPLGPCEGHDALQQQQQLITTGPL